MGLTRWSDFDRTFTAMDQLRRRMDRLYEADWPRAARAYFDEPEATWGRGNAFPRVNFHDAGSFLLLTAEVPGVAVKDLDLTVNQDVLTMKGERRPDAPEGYSVHRQERLPVRFARSFTLPCKVDLEKTTADVKDGILTLVLPKAAEAQPRQIAVRSEAR